MQFTKYDDVNKVLELLTTGLKAILGDNLIALYLTGSLTYGDFNYGSSDIDFLAVIRNKLSESELKAIKSMHNSIAMDIPYWAKRLEGSYVPLIWLQNSKRPQNKRLYFNAGIALMLPYGNEWLINLYSLYEYGIPLEGKDAKKIVKQVNINDVKKASKKNLLSEWEPKLKKENPFIDPPYDSSHLQTYAILTMCRILYLAKKNKLTSKKTAAEWADKTYKQWSNLIEIAQKWQHGIKINKKNDIKEFIRFVVSEIN